MSPLHPQLLAQEPVDVVRPTVSTAFGSAADVAAVAAVAASVVLAGLVVARRLRGGAAGGWVAPSWLVAVVASVAELVLRALDLLELGAAGSTVEALTSRRPVVVVARLVVLALAFAVARGRDVLAPRERWVAEVVAVLGLVAAAVLDAPRTGAEPLAWGVAAATAGLAVTAWFALLLHDRRPALHGRRIPVAVALAATAALALPVVAPPSSVGTVHRTLTHDAGSFDVTVAPGRAGTNELHLYAFDGAGSPLALDHGRLVVGGAATALLTAGGNHLLTYALSLPEAPAWRVTIEVVADDGRSLTATTELP